MNIFEVFVFKVHLNFEDITETFWVFKKNFSNYLDFQSMESFNILQTFEIFKIIEY